MGVRRSLELARSFRLPADRKSHWHFGNESRFRTLCAFRTQQETRYPIEQATGFGLRIIVRICRDQTLLKIESASSNRSTDNRSDMNSLLQVRNLDVAYVSSTGVTTWALVGIDFELVPGEILGVLGESGSGKSTLAQSLLSLLPANGKIRRGEILLEGKDVLRIEPAELRRLRGKDMSLIFQEPFAALQPTIPIGDQIGEVLRAHASLTRSSRCARVRQILAEVFSSDSERIMHSYPHQLSGGQRQRALMAQAIANRPKLLVADEPTASLDATTQLEILVLFKALREKFGVAVIFITHNPALLAGFADRVLVIYAGRIVEWGSAQQVLFSPQHPYTKALLRCVPAFDAAYGTNRKTGLQAIKGLSPYSASLAEACEFAPRCEDRMDICQIRKPGGLHLNETHRVFCFKFSREV